MKLYELAMLPNPRRVRIFLAEKGLLNDIELVQVDVLKGEHRTAEFKAKNPTATVPVLELDNGQYISETVSICRYFEALNPGGSLFGETAEEIARTDMWQRRIEGNLLGTLGTYFHQGTDGLGELELYQNKDWGLENFDRFKQGLDWLNSELNTRNYAAGDQYSIADITLLCTLDFALFIQAIEPKNYPAIATWYERVSSRESAKA